MAIFRSKCISIRREIYKFKKPGTRAAPYSLLLDFRVAKANLRRAIFHAKKVAWNNLISDVDANPWGRAYKIVIKKFKIPDNLNPLVSLPLEDLLVILNDLFPSRQDDISHFLSTPSHKEDVNALRSDIISAVAKTAAKKSAPGPDGVPGHLIRSVLSLTPQIIEDCLRLCLEDGNFPLRWKKARFVLFSKPNKIAGTVGAYRQICLLDNLGKVLERIIFSGLLTCLEPHEEGKNLSSLQFGFHRGRCTLDAIIMLRNIIEDYTSAGKLGLIVNLKGTSQQRNSYIS